MLTGRVRTDLRRAALFKAYSDERRLTAVEQLIPLAEAACLPMMHLAMAFAIAHPGVTSAIIGPHTMEQLDDLLGPRDHLAQTRRGGLPRHAKLGVAGCEPVPAGGAVIPGPADGHRAQHRVHGLVPVGDEPGMVPRFAPVRGPA